MDAICYSNLINTDEAAVLRFIEEEYLPGAFIFGEDSFDRIKVYYSTYFTEDGDEKIISFDQSAKGEIKEIYGGAHLFFNLDLNTRLIKGVHFITLGYVPVGRLIAKPLVNPEKIYAPCLELPKMHDDYLDSVDLPDNVYKAENGGITKLYFGSSFVVLQFKEGIPSRVVTNGVVAFGLDESNKELLNMQIDDLTPQQIFSFCFASRSQEWKDKFPQIYNHPKPHEYIQHGNI